MKLYWRFKKKGKWTWRAARYYEIAPNNYAVSTLHVDGTYMFPEEEEE